MGCLLLRVVLASKSYPRPVLHRECLLILVVPLNSFPSLESMLRIALRIVHQVNFARNGG